MNVVLSYGMGVDSTAILMRWLTDSSSRDFDLDDLVVITAMTGDEFPDTKRMVETHLLPRLREQRVRFVQVARAGLLQADGIVVLDDSRTPTTLHLEGRYKLSDELAQGGTVPQVAAGRRLCSVKFKGWPLDTWIASELRGRSFRHIIGFNADEPKRAAKDTSYSDEQRNSEYPLIEWGWGREFCEQWLLELVGERWPKSCCTYCPFARDNHLDRYRDEPDAAVKSMLMEHTSIALNPRMTLFSSKSIIRLVEDDNPHAADEFYRQVADLEHAVYEVRRVFFAKRGDSSKKGSSARAVRTLSRGPAVTCHVDLRRRVEAESERLGRPITHSVENGVMRAWTHRARTDHYPTVERFLVVAPAGVADKQRPSFEGWWRQHSQLAA